MSKVGVVGGGAAGLALAHDLSRAGHQVTLFEATSELGGLARSFQFGDIHIERYYHFICAGDIGYFRKLRELGIEDKLRWKPTKMGFFNQGKLYPFSSGFDLLKFGGTNVVGRFRYGFLILYCLFVNHWRHLDQIPAEQWLMRLLGYNTYMVTWYPLLKVKFGEYHDRISAAWVWHRIHRVAQSRKTPLHREMLGYLEGGTDIFIKSLVQELRQHGGSVMLSRPVAKIIVDDGQVWGLHTTDGQRWHFDYVVSAVPLPVFLHLTPDLPPDYRSKLAAIDFIGVICLILRLRYPLTGNFWLNINDPRVPFNGCIEYTNLNKQATSDGSAVLYVPYYLPHKHERFHYSDEQLLQECAKALTIVSRDFNVDWIIDYAVTRDPFAQVICTNDFAQRIPAHVTPIRNLYLIESSQLYPADRTISSTIDLAHKVALTIVETERSTGNV